MNTFKRKALFTAVLAGLGAAGTAEAVYLNPNGTGQALVYPYYTVQQSQGASWNTYLSVVNTTSRAKAVKVRILEGKTSAEVLDFNLYLSANDVWTAVIFPSDPNDANSPAAIGTTDRSCTAPVGQMRLDNGGSGERFRNALYSQSGTVDASIGTGLERTREGYVEIIEMGALTGAWATAATHNSAGVPANCSVFNASATLTPSSIEAPTGGLMGTGTLINVANGQDAGYKADALEAWRSAPFYTDAGATSPNLGDATPATSVVINAGGIGATGASTLITAYRSDFGAQGTIAGARAVASVFTHAAVMNEYVLDQASASATDWVLTQPLKRQLNPPGATTAVAPYTNITTSAGACETISFTFFNREEQSATATAGDFSPTLPGPSSALCWEANVLSIRNTALSQFSGLPSNRSAVLGSANVTNVNVTASSNFQNGWALLSFTGTNAQSPGAGLVSDATSTRIALDSAAGAPVAGAVTFVGLPVTGFMIRNFKNGNLNCPASSGSGNITCQGNYGSLFNHSYRNIILP